MSRVLRAVRHLREAATKFTFCISVDSLTIHLDEPATVIVDLTRGPRRVRGNATIELSKGDNEVSLNIPLQCNATLFKPKSIPQASSNGVSSLKKQKSKVEGVPETADATAAGAAADEVPFLPKKAQLQLLDVSKSRRVGGRLLSRMRPSPSVSFVSALPRDPSAAASISLSPDTAAEIRESGVLVAEASFDLASFAAAHSKGMQSQTICLPLEKAKGQITISISLHKLEGLFPAAASPNPTATSAGEAATARPPASAATAAATEAEKDVEPLVLRLPHKETLPSSLETPTLEEETPPQPQPQAGTAEIREAAAAAGAEKKGAANASAADNAQQPPMQELASTGTATTPAELSPIDSQRQPKQGTQQQQGQQQQQQAELRRKDEMIASLQRQVALMEAENRQAAAPQLAQLFAQIDELHTALAASRHSLSLASQAENRQAAAPQLAQLFAQIDELHTALAAAQEQQLAAAEQLQHEREKGDSSAVAAALQQQLQDAEQQLQQLERQRHEMQLQQQELQQKNSEQQQELLQLQAERDGMRLIADAYKKQLEEAHQQQQQQHQQQQQPQEEKMVLLLQQAEQWELEKQQLQSKLADETRERESALNEVRLLQEQLQQQQLLQQGASPSSDPSTVLQQQIMSLQRQLVEAADTKETLRIAKDRTIAELTKALQEMQQKQGEAQAAQQKTMQKLNTFKEEAEALREKIRCQEETLQRLPTQAAWSCAQQQHQLLLQQQREWQEQQEQQQLQQELQLAAKTRRIEELEKELVHVKVELAAAEQRRHEDIDAFKKKLQAVKETVVAYAAASSTRLQAQSSFHSYRGTKHSSSSSSGKGSPVKRLVHISSLKALFRSSTSSRHSNSHSRSSSRSIAAADDDIRPAAATTSKSIHLGVQRRSLSGSRSDLLRSSSNAKGTSNGSTTSYSSSCKAPPAPVSLFGTQPLSGVPRGPSVTRFSASKSGGCNVVTHCLP
ncbi:pseudouridylate synthase 1, putative [Eimeria praecox]|uniref:Pseudouridylate synthase 1, putative n=1 Tax=Eimeria praecox TaxID=51316 RepID=U6H3C8_9EIME|nr:pseudouridylate synthase 1, putative [Eimeria praecox]